MSADTCACTEGTSGVTSAPLLCTHRLWPPGCPQGVSFGGSQALTQEAGSTSVPSRAASRSRTATATQPSDSDTGASPLCMTLPSADGRGALCVGHSILLPLPGAGAAGTPLSQMGKQAVRRSHCEAALEPEPWGPKPEHSLPVPTPAQGPLAAHRAPLGGFWNQTGLAWILALPPGYVTRGQ